MECQGQIILHECSCIPVYNMVRIVSSFPNTILSTRWKGLLTTLYHSACVTSIIRLHSIYTAAHSTDLTWNNIDVVTWSTVEFNTGIICACLPTLKPMINIMSPRLLGSHSSQPTRASRSIHVRRTVQRSYEGLDSVSLQDRKKQEIKYEWNVIGPDHASA